MFELTENRVVGYCSPPMVSVEASGYSPSDDLTNHSHFTRVDLEDGFGRRRVRSGPGQGGSLRPE